MGHAYRTNPPALIAPFEYTSMPLAVIYGLVFFGTFPDAQGWVGIALITAGVGFVTQGPAYTPPAASAPEGR